MADTESASVPKDEPVQGTVPDKVEEAQSEAPSASNKEQESAAPAKAPAKAEAGVPAPGTVTAEVNAPDGNGTAEAVVADASGDASADGKDKKRKSTGGVPEHKSKKLNKKKSSASLTLNLDCKPGELYWARLKGYAPWPAVIADEEMLPESLLASRPVSTERPDGSLRDDFKEGGKNAKDRTFPIMFLSTNEFAWIPNTSLTPLDPEDCKNKSSKVSKALAAAYELATQQPDLAYFKRVLQQFQDETAAYEAEQRQKQAEAAEKAAAKAEAKEKKARKSKGGDGDADTEDADKSSSKKRKKDAADTDGDASKAKKTPKITKLNAPKTNGDSSKKESASKPKKASAPKKEGKQEQKPELTEAEKIQQREKGVLYLRHRLQKAFLSSDSAPKEEDMAGMNDFFVQLEAYDELEPAIIRQTKIHKVLKAIIKLNSVPKDDEYNFKKRSQVMLETWNKRMEANGDSAPSKPSTSEEKPAPKEEAKAEAEKPATNGDAEVKPEQAEQTADAIDKKIESAETSESKKPEAVEAQDAKSAADADGDVKMNDA